MKQQLTDTTVIVDAPRQGGRHPRHIRGPNPVVRTTMEGCEVESRNTYGGVPLSLLPAVWEVEDREGVASR